MRRYLESSDSLVRVKGTVNHRSRRYAHVTPVIHMLALLSFAKVRHSLVSEMLVLMQPAHLRLVPVLVVH